MLRIAMLSFFLVLSPFLADAALITGLVTSEEGNLVSAGFVVLFDDLGDFVAFDDLAPGGDGAFIFFDLPAGEYRLLTVGTGFLDELWDDLPCPQADCDPISGTPIIVGESDAFVAIFVLDLGAVIAGSVTHSLTGSPIPSGSVGIFDHAGEPLGAASIVAGEYRYGGLVPGTYFAATENTQFNDEVFDGHPCVRCEISEVGTPIVLPESDSEFGADFALSGILSPSQ